MANNKSATNGAAILGFEADLWRAADALRSNMDAAESCRIAPHQARDLLARLVRRGVLARQGQRKGAFYVRAVKNMEQSIMMIGDIHIARIGVQTPDGVAPWKINTQEMINWESPAEPMMWSGYS